MKFNTFTTIALTVNEPKGDAAQKKMEQILAAVYSVCDPDELAAARMNNTDLVLLNTLPSTPQTEAGQWPVQDIRVYPKKFQAFN